MRGKVLMQLLILFFTLCSYVHGYRNWPQWGNDESHMRYQSFDDKQATPNLCAVTPLTTINTTSNSAIVYQGVQYYATDNYVISYNLDSGSVGFSVDATNLTGFSPNSVVSLSMIQINSTNYIIGFFTDTNASSVVFLLQLDGSVIWSGFDAGIHNATSITVHSWSAIVLGYESHIEVISLPVEQNKIQQGKPYKHLWSTNPKESYSYAILTRGDEVSVVLFSPPTLDIRKAAHGGDRIHTMDFPTATELVYVNPQTIVLASATSGILVSIQDYSVNHLDNIVPLAAASMDTLVGYNTTTGEVVLMPSAVNGTNQKWGTAYPLSGRITASVDGAGIVYIVANDKLVAFKLVDGKHLWEFHLDLASYFGSPIIASSTSVSYLFVDTGNQTLQVYKGACNTANATCSENTDFVCSCDQAFYGYTCSTFCQANITCSDSGSCNPENGKCACNNYYYGSNCGQYCNDITDKGKQKQNCFHGSCNKNTGQCHCDQDYFTNDCSVYCNDTATCHTPNGTCGTDGKCNCIAGSFFDITVHGGRNCDLVTNLSFVAFLIAIIVIAMLCAGIAVCCCCEKTRKLERDQFSLLTGDTHGHHKH